MLEKENRMIISVELTQEMIQELDVVVEKEKMGRSEVIMEATQQFLQEKRARELRDEMERGYAEMATNKLVSLLLMLLVKEFQPHLVFP
ncbi:transcriptional regulator [Listeria monocytogenes serotype 1/2a str. 88-0478]|nr:transcriptional regulator [Listeria monocytogenes serotype 1/2a str. 88-0478]